MKVKALRSFRYRHRMLRAGDVFEPESTRDEKILRITRRIVRISESLELEDPRVALREAYQRKAGKRPFAGWTAEQLQQKLDELEGET